MKVKLLKDVIQDGHLKSVLRPNRPAVPFVKGAVIEVSESTAEKWTADGTAEPYEEPDDEPAERDSPPARAGADKGRGRRGRR